MYGHVQWHLALAEWQLGFTEQAWQRYERYCAPEATRCGPVTQVRGFGGQLVHCVGTRFSSSSNQLSTTSIWPGDWASLGTAASARRIKRNRSPLGSGSHARPSRAHK